MTEARDYVAVYDQFVMHRHPQTQQFAVRIRAYDLKDAEAFWSKFISKRSDHNGGSWMTLYSIVPAESPKHDKIERHPMELE